MTSSTTGSTLSPQQRHQSSTIRAKSEEARGHKRNKSVHLKYNPYDLHHVPSLRNSPRRSPYRAGPTSLRQVVEEPDFGTEERDVWSRRSPSEGVSTAQDTSFTLQESTSPNPQKSNLPVLQPRIVIHADPDERPKTRRGPSGSSMFDSLRMNQDNDDEKGSEDENERGSPKRNPKFVEGTMTSRSSAVASTWPESDYAMSSSETEDTDSDATPKASRKRRSSSFDLREFQPPALTPSAIKRTLFGRREGKRDKKAEKHIKAEQPQDSEVKKPRKRLRKSISKLQFLGEKMKLFGPSAHDLPEQAVRDTVEVSEDERSVLDERKRKAEAAYAEQFGLKKQRDNNGSACVTSSPQPSEEAVLPDNQKYDTATVKHRGRTIRSRRLTTGSMFEEDKPGTTDINEHDIRKRPSRRELEKENQQLRALLRQSQTMEDQALAYNSEPEIIPPVPPLKIRKGHAGSTSRRASTDSTFTINNDPLDTDVPPVPPLHPDRKALSNISNSMNNSRRGRTPRASFSIVADSDPSLDSKPSDLSTDAVNPLQNAPKLNPTSQDKKLPNNTHTTAPRPTKQLVHSVSMILEEPEDDIAGEKKRSLRNRINTTAGGKENLVSAVTAAIAMADNAPKGQRAEEWQWPEDVF